MGAADASTGSPLTCRPTTALPCTLAVPRCDPVGVRYDDDAVGRDDAAQQADAREVRLPLAHKALALEVRRGAGSAGREAQARIAAGCRGRRGVVCGRCGYVHGPDLLSADAGQRRGGAGARRPAGTGDDTQGDGSGDEDGEGRPGASVGGGAAVRVARRAVGAVRPLWSLASSVSLRAASVAGDARLGSSIAPHARRTRGHARAAGVVRRPRRWRLQKQVRRNSGARLAVARRW